MSKVKVKDEVLYKGRWYRPGDELPKDAVKKVTEVKKTEEKIKE